MKNQIELSAKTDSGVVDLFLPYYLFPAGKKKVRIGAKYTGKMVRDGEVEEIGKACRGAGRSGFAGNSAVALLCA